MRKARVIGEGRSFYHLMSRIIDRQYLIKDEEKEYFYRTMRMLEAFHGVRVVTYCILSNHFHLLVEVPDKKKRDPLTKEDILKRLEFLENENDILRLKQDFKQAEKLGAGDWEEQLIEKYETRIGDVSCFMRELKQRFTQWYNRRNGRKGTLWEERFKSVLIEGCERALLTVAAYIDLNPVRAGIVDDPKDYRWCGYAEAVAGGRKARRGLARMLSEALLMEGHDYESNWRKTGARYRLLLFGKGEEKPADEVTGKGAKRGFSREKIEEVRKRGGKLSMPEVLRCRVRYFSDGAVLGTAEFVNGVFKANPGRFGGPARETGARKMRGAEWGELRSMRDLRVDVVS